MLDSARWPVRVAVIDDDRACIEVFFELLTDEGMDVTCYRAATGVFAALSRSPPHLIVLDMHLETPEAGWQLLELLRQSPVTASIPIIVCTANLALLRERDAQLRAHRAIPLAKPFDLTDLLALVEQALTDPPAETPERVLRKKRDTPGHQ